MDPRLMNLRQFFATNHWWGKILGALFGYLLGGPAVALFGLLIGNFFDRSLNQHFSRPYWYLYMKQRHAVHSYFFKATFSIMGHIAKSDGRVSEAEIQAVNSFMNEIHLNREQKKCAQDFFNDGKKSHFNLPRMLHELAKETKTNPQLLKVFVDIQYRIAQIDGLTIAKMQALDLILSYLGFAPLRDQFRFEEQPSNQRSYTYNRNRAYQTHQYNTIDPLSEAFNILELNKTANKQEVKRAYRRLISLNHPDKLIAKGLSEEQIKHANDKTQKIRKAYEKICENKGW